MPYSPRRSREQWQALVTEQQQSGLSAPQFCKEYQIAYASFSAWRKRLSRAEPAELAPPSFVELSQGKSLDPCKRSFNPVLYIQHQI